MVAKYVLKNILNFLNFMITRSKNHVEDDPKVKRLHTQALRFKIQITLHVTHLDGVHILNEFLDLINQPLILLLRRLLHSTAFSKLQNRNV